MTDDEDTSDNPSGGGASLDGYFYQVDVSIWAALDLLLAKKLAQQLVLEPASKEDLEATLAHDEPGRLAAKVDINASTLLVVQAKLRNTGPWKVGELTSLLQHGADRPPANVLLGELRAEMPGITPVHILHGPEEVRADNHAEPVVFVIEDPWGKYRLEPRSQPWNDEIDKLLATANGNRRFIITSRSDVLAESHTRKLNKKWNVSLEAENYGLKERERLFEYRLPALLA